MPVDLLGGSMAAQRPQQVQVQLPQNGQRAASYATAAASQVAGAPMLQQAQTMPGTSTPMCAPGFQQIAAGMAQLGGSLTFAVTPPPRANVATAVQQPLQAALPPQGAPQLRVQMPQGALPPMPQVGGSLTFSVVGQPQMAMMQPPGSMPQAQVLIPGQPGCPVAPSSAMQSKAPPSSAMQSALAKLQAVGNGMQPGAPQGQQMSMTAPPGPGQQPGMPQSGPAPGQQQLMPGRGPGGYAAPGMMQAPGPAPVPGMQMQPVMMPAMAPAMAGSSVKISSTPAQVAYAQPPQAMVQMPNSAQGPRPQQPP